VANIYSNSFAFVAVGPESLAYGSVVTGTGNSFTKGGACTDCPEGFQNQYRNATLKDGPVNTCTVRNCLVNEYSDGSTCQPCAQYTGAASAGIDPTAGPTACTAITCKADERVVDNVCTACDSTSYRAPGDQIFGGDTHCFCKDNHKVIDKACVACEEGSSNPNLCYSGLQDHYCICDANYHVVNKTCTACPAGATRPAGDYGGNGDTHCICGEDQHVVNNVCTPCTGGAKRPAGDDSSGVDTVCSCVDNEHVKNISNVLQCSTCPTGSVRAAGDFPAGGVTSCACPEDFHVSGGQCVACVGGTRAAGDDPLAGDTHCACNENHRVVSNVCTSCPEGQERAAGDDASGADTSCLCEENFFSNGDGTCSSCDTANGAVLAAGSDPAIASQCQCGAGYETSGASCSQCAATEESVTGEACKCKENHYYDGSACTACVAGSTHPAGDDKTATTSCTIVTCAENEHVVNHVCVPCVSGMVRAAGDEATGDVTECAYQGTSHVVSTSGNFVYKIDGGSNNGELTVRVGETHSFYRDSAGNPFRIVTEADCDGKDCDKAQYNALPESSLGVEDAEQNVAVTVFAPAEAGLYYYMSTTNGYRKGRITAKWPLCVITYPVTTLTGSCELSSEVALTGDLTITYSLARLRAQSGDVPQIVAASSSRHFTVSGGHKLSIENLDLSGGRSAEGGSILVDQGEIDINNVKFTDNIATGAGGAIRVKNALSKVNMNNILFDGNQGSEGGAISILDAMAEKVEIHNSDFKNNLAASGDGGAIKADSVLNITLTNFEDNNANSGEGGGISSTKDVTLTGSSFRRNKALRGGALKSKDNRVDMSNMVIEANEAIEEGGAFNVENAELDVQSSTISANKAKKGAAVKSSSSGCTTDCKKVRIRSSSISDNEASSEGGDIDFGGDTDADPQ
jgi:predicted outer membrane repeat protein